MKLLLRFTVLTFISACAILPAAEKPNFVVIMVDDMGYAGVSCFGNPYFKTPQIIVNQEPEKAKRLLTQL